MLGLANELAGVRMQLPNGNRLHVSNVTHEQPFNLQALPIQLTSRLGRLAKKGTARGSCFISVPSEGYSCAASHRLRI